MQNPTSEAPSNPATDFSSMNTDNIKLVGAREALVDGIMKAASAIAGTLGPSGYSLIVEDALPPGHMIVDDGWLALQRIKLQDPMEQRGVEILKEAVGKANKESGDGSTTTTILTAILLQEGVKLALHGKAIKESLDACLPIIEASLQQQTEQITPHDIARVATISSGDAHIGELLQGIYEEVGKDGIVELDFSHTPMTTHEMVEGVRLINCGFMYPYMANEDQGRKSVFLNPKILITKQKISTVAQLDPLFKSFSSGGTTELVIFCKDIELNVQQTLALTQQGGHFRTLVIKAPNLWQDWLFEDFAAITGARVIDPEQGTSLERLSLTHLGTCDKLVTSAYETLVIGIGDITKHLEKIKEIGKTDEQQLLRLSWLQTKTAIIKLGAQSESELSLLRAKVEDARNASYHALQHGVVPGAGLALMQAARNLPETPGGQLLRVALAAPNAQLRANMELKAGDALHTEGIVDPTLVVLNAIKNAISIAGTVLTSKGVIQLQK